MLSVSVVVRYNKVIKYKESGGNMKYIDSHAHYLSYKFRRDRDSLVYKLLKNDVELLIECGTDTKSNLSVLELCKKFKNMYAVIGYFPTSVSELDDIFVLNQFKGMLENEKVIGLGEIGLDYHHKGDKKMQADWFKEQLKIAKEFNLPVCIHSREAEDDTLKILSDFGSYRGVVHCYSYGVESMHELLDLGYYFGIGGTCTYKNNVGLREAIKEMPLNRILLETDAPYLSPQEVRGKRNDSRNIKYVISELSKLKGVSEEKIIKQTNQNVYDLYFKGKSKV